MIPVHEVSVVANGHRVPGWTNYRISTDMLQPADSFDLSVAFSPEAWELLPTDQEVTVFLDSTKILTGYVDTRRKVSDVGSGTILEITGRDRAGRLVDESCPLFSYGGRRIKDLAEKICGITDDAEPLFERVTLANTRNRSLVRNVRARKARIVREPVLDVLAGTFRPIARIGGYTIPHIAGGPLTTRRIERPALIDPGIFQGSAAPKKVTPGATRWAVLEDFLREARLLAWASADGVELFVGLPNYDQESQYFLFEAAEISRNRDETNCRITVAESVQDRYSKITAVGAAKGTGTSYGRNVTKNRASVYDNPEDDVNGVGISFRRRKTLLITDDGIKNARDALERAEREQLERDAGALEVTVDASGHSQLYSGETPAIFAIDTMAKVHDEDTGTRGEFLVTSVEFSQDAERGTRTTLKLVPRGTLLQL